jgi:hypothetical protein
MKTRIGKTMSGDLYSGTDKAWERYRKAWEDDNMHLVAEMEEGMHKDFFYDPEGRGNVV